MNGGNEILYFIKLRQDGGNETSIVKVILNGGNESLYLKKVRKDGGNETLYSYLKIRWRQRNSILHKVKTS